MKSGKYDIIVSKYWFEIKKKSTAKKDKRKNGKVRSVSVLDRKIFIIFSFNKYQGKHQRLHNNSGGQSTEQKAAVWNTSSNCRF